MISIRECLAILIVAGLVQGCSARTWYDGLKQAQAAECVKLHDKDRDACLQDTRVSYDQYQRDRQEILKQHSD